MICRLSTDWLERDYAQPSTCFVIAEPRLRCDRGRRQRGKKVYPIIIKPAAALGGGTQQGIDKETGDCAQSCAQRFAEA